MTQHPTPAATFPQIARFALAVLVALVTYFVAGDYIHIGEAERAVISSITLLLASVGIVPLKPEDIKMSAAVAVVLTVVAILLNYVIISVADLEPVLRGILAALLAFASSLGIVPPQVARR